jgi:hypothetical protein
MWERAAAAASASVPPKGFWVASEARSAAMIWAKM